MKDEMGGVAIKEFLEVQAMMYSILTTNKKETKTAKGIKKSVVKHRAEHSNLSIASSISAHIYPV